ncbi:hypothetical protein RAE21_02930 [Rhodoferax sp. TBRC 17198]|jgi:hypothetical protein|uniref:hypothetical protein n=1 Tax=Rhodoferax potami TaxID=3068338 RepID=UPI0028BE8069|nr:hypothetical protein [Rhodoferax sp. TBRC 17198]MDT7521366.1 hypothetical protein [Rhodoferax sp. TBRC 17198]
MSNHKLARRSVVRTILVVGEGYSEEYFLKHLVGLYVQRGCGFRFDVKNARGMGASHVVNVVIRQSRNADFDHRVALLDTDVGWDQRTESIARKERIQVLASTPCLEGLLLQIHKKSIQDRTTEQLKQAFEAAFGGPASEPRIYPRFFTKAVLEDARTTVATLQALLTLLETGK